MATTVAPEQTQSSLQPPIFLEKSGRQSPRPNFSSSKPSWIGPHAPPRTAAPEISNMAQKAQIHYSHPGLQPPVFIAGSLCKPQWEPVEMAYKEKEDGELDFWHEFDVQPGQYQYKFRLGPGDWWALDESKPIVDDGAGNRNNLLTVERAPLKSNNDDAAVQPPPTVATNEAPVPEPEQTFHNDESSDDVDEVPESELNLFRHETKQYIDDPDQDADDDDFADGEDDEEPPLLEHEAGPFKRVDSKHVSPLKTDNFFDNPAEFEVEADDEIEHDDEDEEEAPCPLFRHETLAASDAAPDEAPLFRHESMSSIDSLSVDSQSPTSRKHHPLDSEDINDPSLERFPTDQAGILAHLQRAETRLREDETVFEGTPLSPTLAQSKTFTSQPSPVSLRNEPSDSSHLDSIDETEETDEAENKDVTKSVEKKDSIVEPIPIAIKVQDVSEIQLDKPSVTQVPDVSNRGPPTPPMTPTDHPQGKAGAHDGPADLPTFETPRSRKDNTTDHIASQSTSSDKSIGDEAKRSFVSNFWYWFAGLCGGSNRATGVAITMGVAAAAVAMNVRSA